MAGDDQIDEAAPDNVVVVDDVLDADLPDLEEIADIEDVDGEEGTPETDDLEAATAETSDIAEGVEEEVEAPEEALDELEAEELDMLTEDEASEVIAVDEAAEIRALRREELALDVDAEGPGSDEFVCQSCFLVKRIAQLSDKRRQLCRDCVG